MNGVQYDTAVSNLKVDVVLDLLYKVLHLTDNQLTLQQRWSQFYTDNMHTLILAAVTHVTNTSGLTLHHSSDAGNQYKWTYTSS